MIKIDVTRVVLLKCRIIPFISFDFFIGQSSSPVRKRTYES